MLPDQVRLTNRTIDNDNVVTEDAPFTTRAYVENASREVVSSNGTVVNSVYLIMLPHDTNITETTKVEFVKLQNRDPIGSEIGPKMIKAVHRVGGFSVSHIEAYV